LLARRLEIGEVDVAIDNLAKVANGRLVRPTELFDLAAGEQSRRLSSVLAARLPDPVDARQRSPTALVPRDDRSFDRPRRDRLVASDDPPGDERVAELDEPVPVPPADLVTIGPAGRVTASAKSRVLEL
jgi:hypothetical protein